MATIEQAMWSYVSSGTAISSLIGTRLHPVYVPDGVTLPAVAYQRIATRRDPAQPVSANNTLVMATFQFACIDDQYSVTKSIADAIRLRLDRYGGTIIYTGGTITYTGGTITYTGGTVVVQSILCRNEFTIYTETENRDNSTFTTFLDAQVWYYE